MKRCAYFVMPAILVAASLLVMFWAIPVQVSVFGGGSPGLGPRFFPTATAALVGLFALIRLMQVALGHDHGLETPDADAGDEADSTSVPWRWIFLSVLVFAIVYVAILLIGLLATCFFTLLGFTYAFRVRSHTQVISISAIGTLLVYLFFTRLAAIPLPQGAISAWLP
ncbi:tripartite tricarboxylate transporter TctB family protein [Roseovarius confluentis]|uniref:tripartite tricarboxylate transporter TctB family protein n=1 Tax=Roseovarius confluentis TaxID=1852027 RepID=UPI003BA93640